MVTEKFLVPAVSCQHCVRAVSKEVGALAGVQKVDVNLENKVVTVEHGDQVAAAAIVAAIQEAGYAEVTPVA